MKLITSITIFVIFLTSTGFIPIRDINQTTEYLRHDHAFLEERSSKWYEGKQFVIATLGERYIYVTILGIIYLNEHNIMIMFKDGGSVIYYVPFNRITYMYEIEGEQQ